MNLKSIALLGCLAATACATTPSAPSAPAAPGPQPSVPERECLAPQYGEWVPDGAPERVRFPLNGTIIETERMVVFRDVVCATPADTTLKKKD